MEKLRFGVLFLICALLIGCGEARPSAGPQAQPMQPDTAGGDRGGMH